MTNGASPRILHNRYELESLIARGGMAEVYLAHDLQLDRRVAVKILFPEFAREQSFVERFRREAQSAANLNHPNIVAIYDWGETEGTYFIVMEYVQGHSLRELLKESGPLDSDDIAEYGTDIAAALAYAHQHGVVHRDIKPGNVLITDTGKVKVTDFGIARAGTSESLTQTGSVMGTATYFSPEQAQGYSVDGRSDIYSLGVVMYELATGVTPFTADTPIAVAFKHVSEKLVPPSTRNPEVAPDLEAIICKCLEKDPDKRYANANDLNEDCVRFLRRRPVLAAAPEGVDPNATVMNAALVDVPDTTGRTQAVGTASAVAAGVATQDASNAYAFDDKKRKGPMVIVISMVVILALALGGILIASAMSGGGSGGTVELPNVVGKTKGAATKELSNLDLVVTTKLVVNEDVKAGIVFAQDPEAGTKMRKKNTVTLSVSAGIGQSKVPDVAGMSITDAILDLEDAGFIAVQKEEPSDSVEKDKVTRTKPKAGTKLDRGSSVEVYVSTGSAQVAVPNVIGLDSGTASNQLGQADFTTVTQEEASDTIPIGKVIRTDPVANTMVDRGSTVTLYVSTGPAKITVPNVKGETVANATTILTNAGFGVTATGSNSSIVTSQSPAGGSQQTKGTMVTIVGSTGPTSP